VFFENSIFISQANYVPKFFYGLVPQFVHFFPLVIIVISFFSFFIYYLVIMKKINSRVFFYSNSFGTNYLFVYKKYFTFFNKKFFIDDFYNIVALTVYKISYIIFRVIDKGLLEFLGPRGLTNVLYKLGLNFTKRFQSGYIYQYTFIILLNFFFIFFIFLFLI
jgi:hypothetical protein